LGLGVLVDLTKLEDSLRELVDAPTARDDSRAGEIRERWARVAGLYEQVFGEDKPTV